MTESRSAKGARTKRANRLAADIRRAEKAGLHQRGEQTWVPVSALFSDSRYQRTVNMADVQRMGREFDPDALGVIYVSDRANGTYAVLDGFHRVSLMRHLEWSDQTMPAFVYSGLTVEEEARIFRKMNKDRRQPQRLDLFRAAVTAQEPDALTLAKVFDEVGVTVSPAAGPTTFRSLATAEKILKITGDPTILSNTLRILMKAWPQYDEALNGDLTSGCALLVFANPELDGAILASHLADHSPGMVLNKAKVTREVNDELLQPAAIATVMTAVYNKGLRAKRLSEFHYRGWPKRSPAGALYGNGWTEEAPGDDDI